MGAAVASINPATATGIFAGFLELSMIFFAVPAVLELALTVFASTIAAKVANDIYDAITKKD